MQFAESAGVSSDGGFTLVELLVATTITLVVLGVTMQAFSDALRANQAVVLLADTNENLRAGTNMMTRDLQQVGRSIPVGGIPIPTDGPATALVRPSPPGQNYTFPVGPTLPAVTAGDGLGPTLSGGATDIVTVLYADSLLSLDTLPLTAIANDGSTATVPDAIPINVVGTAVTAGDLIMFSNGQGNALQMVTSVDGQVMTFAANDALNVNQRGATNGTIMNIRTGTTFPPTTATRIVMVTYYLDATIADRPRLMRRLNSGVGRPVAVVMENLQLTYDIVDGVTNPSNQPAPVAPNTPNQIREANLFLAARSVEQNWKARAFFRNSLSTQVSLRSLAFVDRYR